MNEREYIKVNTSIQTGSNVNDLKYDADGNIEARIALRLPANLFDNNAGTRKIDKVTMATSKMRLSLENTPIASLPVESTSVKNNTLVLKPQLDVYPFSLTGEKLLVPTSLNDSSFPLYKSHEVLFRIQVVTVLEPLTYVSGGQLQYFPNSPDVYQNTSSLLYPILEKTGVLEQVNHKLNLMMQNNHEPFKMENGHVLIKSLSTLCQIFQDALENAITYASTNDNRVIDVFFVDSTLSVNSLSPNVNKSETYDINGTTTYYWKMENVSATGGSNLNCACKPLVRFNSQSFSISLDTCVFKDIVPIIWNTAFINTFERPQQLIQDLLRQNYWLQPPPKRVYKYGLHQVADESYSYYLLQTLTCRVMNIIGDKIMRDCFSFLPWVEVPQSLVLGGNSYLKSFNVKTETTTYTSDVTHKRIKYRSNIPTYSVLLENPYLADSTGDRRYFHIYRMSFYRLESEGEELYKHFGIIAGEVQYFPGDDEHKPHYYPYPINWEFAMEEPQRNVSPVSSEYLIASHSIPSAGEPVITEEESYDQSLVPGQTRATTHTTTSLDHDHLPIDNNDPEYFGYFYSNFYWFKSGQRYEASQPAVGQWLADEPYYPLRYIPLPAFDARSKPDYGDDTIKYEYTKEFITQEEFLRRWGDSEADPYHGVEYPQNLTSWAFCRVDTWTMPKEFPLGNDPTTFIHNPSATPCVVSDYVYPIVEPYPTVANGEKDIFNTTETDTVTETTITETSNPPIITNTDITPNLKQDSRDSFYLLDGTTCDITIGPQEPILTGERLGKWKITTTTTYEKFEEVDADVYKSGPGFTNVITPYETEDTEYLINNPSGAGDFPGMGNRKRMWYIFVKDTVIEEGTTIPTNIPRYCMGLLMGGNDLGVTLSTTSRTTTGSAGGGYIRTDVGPYERVDPPPTTVEVTYSDDPSLEPGTTTEDEETRTRESMPWRRSELITSNPMIHARNKHGTEEKWVKLSTLKPNLPGLFYATLEYIALDAGNLRTDCGYEALPIAAEFVPDDFGAGNAGLAYIDITGTALNGEEAINYTMVHCAEEVIEAGQTSKYVPVVKVEKYYEVSAPVKTTVLIAHKTTVIEPVLNEYDANLRLTYTWDNLPMVVLSPIQSIVLILDGMNVNQEFLPVNITEQTGSSLVSSVAVIENFYSLATTLRDLHDELIVIKDSFNDMATYNVDDSSGKERTLTLTAKYITKDGAIHSIYIPPNGVFTVQLTFRLDFFTSSSTY